VQDPGHKGKESIVESHNPRGGDCFLNQPQFASSREFMRKRRNLRQLMKTVINGRYLFLPDDSFKKYWGLVILL
jgi:hypothetical protein